MTHKLRLSVYSGHHGTPRARALIEARKIMHAYAHLDAITVAVRTDADLEPPLLPIDACCSWRARGTWEMFTFGLGIFRLRCGSCSLDTRTPYLLVDGEPPVPEKCPQCGR